MDSTKSFLLYNLLIWFPYRGFHYFTCCQLLSNLRLGRGSIQGELCPRYFGELAHNEPFGCQMLPTVQRPALEGRLAAGHHRMNTCSETGKARRWRAWVKMEEVDRKRRGKEKWDQFWTIWVWEDGRRATKICHTPTMCQALCWVLGIPWWITQTHWLAEVWGQSSGQRPGPDKSLPFNNLLRFSITLRIKFKFLNPSWSGLCSPLPLPYPSQQPPHTEPLQSQALAHATPTLQCLSLPSKLQASTSNSFLRPPLQAELAISPLSSQNTSYISLSYVLFICVPSTQPEAWDKAGTQGLRSKGRSELTPKTKEGPRNSPAFLLLGLFSLHPRISLNPQYFLCWPSLTGS